MSRSQVTLWSKIVLISASIMLAYSGAVLIASLVHHHHHHHSESSESSLSADQGQEPVDPSHHNHHHHREVRGIAIIGAVVSCLGLVAGLSEKPSHARTYLFALLLAPSLIMLLASDHAVKTIRGCLKQAEFHVIATTISKFNLAPGLDVYGAVHEDLGTTVDPETLRDCQEHSRRVLALSAVLIVIVFSAITLCAMRLYKSAALVSGDKESLLLLLDDESDDEAESSKEAPEKESAPLPPPVVEAPKEEPPQA